MWEIENLTPFRADKCWIRDREGVHHWLVSVKATYDLDANGRLSLSQDPVDVLGEPEFRGDPGVSSLRFDSDLLGPKAVTDITVNGIAHAVPHARVTERTVGFRVGGVRKSLRVFGPRRWVCHRRGGLSMTDPAPFDRMPIVYEHAFGGTDLSHERADQCRLHAPNPVGTGVAVDSRTLHGLPAPTIETIGGSIEGAAGFGAIASHWSPRREWGGTYDEAWQQSRAPLLAADFDERWYQSAPVDQRTPKPLDGLVECELYGLARVERIALTLPRHRLVFDTFFGGARRPHVGALTSLVFESDPLRVVMVWQTALRCGAEVDELDRTRVRLEADS